MLTPTPCPSITDGPDGPESQWTAADARNADETGRSPSNQRQQRPSQAKSGVSLSSAAAAAAPLIAPLLSALLTASRTQSHLSRFSSGEEAYLRIRNHPIIITPSQRDSHSAPTGAAHIGIHPSMIDDSSLKGLKKVPTQPVLQLNGASLEFAPT